jgi:hypothetical protein
VPYDKPDEPRDVEEEHPKTRYSCSDPESFFLKISMVSSPWKVELLIPVTKARRAE